MAQRSGGSWIIRAAWAGIAAACLGVGLATLNYAQLPGTEAMPWCAMLPAIVGYALVAGVCAGLGLAGATALAVRSGGGPRRVGGLRLAAFGAVGGVVGTALPAVLGVAGFGSLDAPYAGTANLVFAVLVASTTFVALWAPQLQRGCPEARAMGRIEHLGISAMASTLALGSLGILGATACGALGFSPTLEWFVSTAEQVGLVTLGVGTAVVLGAAIGAAAGFACWMYLSAALVLQRQLR
ncbi:MAG: hypothetical protein K1X88_27315 [Nannocystaceae bacterium]|nr:hypothetical protein [Nannocystaceae bacterium]